jgi:hypothetical protein
VEKPHAFLLGSAAADAGISCGKYGKNRVKPERMAI